MANIAYIADEKMLEFHRINRHTKINFWRFSTKAFSELYVGDLVFFVSKDKRFKKDHEKGIVGFGRFIEYRKSSIQQMWKQYQQENGFATYQEFKETLAKYHDNQQISSLVLEDVYFFAQPIYFSDIHLNIAPQLESYTYLSYHLSIQLLKQARYYGVDLWSTIATEQFQNQIQYYLLENELKDCLQDVPVIHYQPKDFVRLKKQWKKYQPEYCYFEAFPDLIYRIDGKINIMFYDVRKQYSLAILGKIKILQQKLGKDLDISIINAEEMEIYV